MIKSSYLGIFFLTDEDGVNRNVSEIVFVRSKSFPPVSLLPTQLTMRVISTRSFISLLSFSSTLRNQNLVLSDFTKIVQNRWKWLSHFAAFSEKKQEE